MPIHSVLNSKNRYGVDDVLISTKYNSIFNPSSHVFLLVRVVASILKVPMPSRHYKFPWRGTQKARKSIRVAIAKYFRNSQRRCFGRRDIFIDTF